MIDAGQELAGGLLAQLERGGVDAGEPQRPQPGEDRVVEADQGQLFRDPDAEGRGGGQCADAGQVVGREDGGRPAGAAQQADRGAVPAFLAHVPRLDTDALAEAGLAHRVLISLHAQPAGHARQAMDVGDPGVSELDQVPDRESAAEMVVVGEDVGAGQVHVQATAADRDGRDLAGRVDDGLRHRDRPGQHEPVDPEIDERPGQGLVQHPVDAAVAEQDVLAAGVQDRGQAVQHVREPGLAQVVQQHADRVGPPLREQPGRRVGPVAELGHRPHDGLAAGRADLG